MEAPEWTARDVGPTRKRVLLLVTPNFNASVRAVPENKAHPAYIEAMVDLQKVISHRQRHFYVAAREYGDSDAPFGVKVSYGHPSLKAATEAAQSWCVQIMAFDLAE